MQAIAPIPRPALHHEAVRRLREVAALHDEAIHLKIA
jgi:hypothetical protein